MWRYMLAYRGWDRCTNALGITQATQEDILSRVSLRLESPKLTDSQRKQILAWIPEEDVVTEDNVELSIDGTWIRDFLGLGDHYHDFPHWLLGEKPMKQAALLAILRNMVCHGSLSPTKTESWGLELVCTDGVHLVSESFYVLLSLIS